MAKVFFKSLPVAAYAYLGGKRIKQSGRIVAWEITSEAGQRIDPFWLVMVRGYKEKMDRPRLIAITGHRWGDGIERFVAKEQALARFEQLASHPGYLAEADRENKRRVASSERLRLRHAKGQVTRPSRLAQQDKNRPRISYSSKVRVPGIEWRRLIRPVSGST
jgi:hypothetical protein